MVLPTIEFYTDLFESANFYTSMLQELKALNSVVALMTLSTLFSEDFPNFI